eukprot:jgi/Ulvmu1/8254/UM041_0065.1
MATDAVAMELADSSECLRCLVVSSGPNADQVMLSIKKFNDQYIWEQDQLVLHTTQDMPCPWHGALPAFPDMQIMWSEICHCGSIDDEWFLVFLLSYITDHFKGTVMAQVFSNEGQFILTEAAHLLPSWVDSVRNGSIDEIAKDRIWLYDGSLHLVPLRWFAEDLSPKALTMSRAVRAVRCSTTATLAPARIQEFLYKRHLSRFPKAIQHLRHRAKVMLPKAAAGVLMRSQQICGCAARAFIERTAPEMRAAMCNAQFWPATPDISAVACYVITMRKSHYGSLAAAPFSAPKSWPMPAPHAGGLSRAAQLGLKLTIGLNLLFLQSSILSGGGVPDTTAFDARMKALPEWQRYLKALYRQNFFGDETDGSAEYHRRFRHAEAAFHDSQVFIGIRIREASMLRNIRALASTPLTDAELKKCDEDHEDSDAWMADEFGQKMDLYSQMQKASTGRCRADHPARATDSMTHDPADLSANDVMDRLSRFLDAGSSVAGAEPDQSSFSCDAEKLLQILEGDSVVRLKDGSDAGEDSDLESDASAAQEASQDEADTASTAPCIQYETDAENRSFMAAYMDQLQTELVEHNGRDRHVDVNMESVANLLKSVTQEASIQPGAAQGLFGMLGVDIPKQVNTESREQC